MKSRASLIYRYSPWIKAGRLGLARLARGRIGPSLCVFVGGGRGQQVIPHEKYPRLGVPRIPD